jgi:hypothetical protein
VKGKMMRFYLLLVIAIFMAGCATPTPTRIRYAHPTATHEQFYDASYQCVDKAISLVSKAQVTGYGEVSPEVTKVDCNQFNACMAKHGFTKSADGTFLTSKDLQLYCK